MTTIPSRRFGGAHVLILSGLLAALWACPRDEGLKGGALPPADCQQDSVLIVYRPDSAKGLPVTVTAEDMPLAREIANLPEYHDCQRFVVRDTAQVDSMVYGPLVSIWAADNLAARLSAEALGESSLAVPVAVIYNAEPQISYPPLGIHPGFSCLYLRKAGGAGWRAAIVRLNGGPGGCDTAVDTVIPDAIWGRLEVRPAGPPSSLQAEDIPEVARWDWDETNKTQYIGIRCGDQWCEIGAPGFESSPSADQIGLTPAWLAGAMEPIPNLPTSIDIGREIRRIVTIKGWYDEQQLDLRDGNDAPVLTRTRGITLPQPGLDSAPFTPGAWTPAAYVILTADYPSPKLPLAQGLNRVYLCRNGEAMCPGTESLACKAEMTAPFETWFMKVTSESGQSQTYCVLRRDHAGQAIPVAAARWNWNEKDAKTWSKCGAACCTGN